jgi:hypothetical protein
MIESMDIAFLLVNISSTNRLFSTVTAMISSVINPLIKNNYDIRLALIQIRSIDHSSTPIVHSFTRSVIKFTHRLLTDRVTEERPTQGETIPTCK